MLISNHYGSCTVSLSARVKCVISRLLKPTVRDGNFVRQYLDATQEAIAMASGRGSLSQLRSVTSSK
eukprot:3665476-Amphidinium_carterae.1